VIWDLLSDALMRSGLIEVLDIGAQDAMKLLLLQDEQVIETLATHAAQKTFTDGIGARSVIGCDWEKVASPDVIGMVLQEGGPGLSSQSGGTHGSHVLLNGAFAHVNAQLQKFTTNPFCSEDGDCPLPSPLSRR
jgi:hypothetical protein